jgi:hypothetical protein
MFTTKKAKLITRQTKQLINIAAHDMGLLYEINIRNKMMARLQNLNDGGATTEELNKQVKVIIETTLETSSKDGTAGAITA